MTWSALDLVVVGVFVAQLVGWFCVVLALRKIKTGPVQTATNRGAQLLGRVQRLAEAGRHTGAHLAQAAQQLLVRLTRLRKRLDVTAPPTGLWVQPHHLRRALELAAIARPHVGKKTASKKILARLPARRNVTLAQRLGLIPPLLVRLAPLGGVVRVALKTLRQLRR